MAHPWKGYFTVVIIFFITSKIVKKKILQPQMGMNGADNMKEWGIADMGGQHHQAGRRKSTKWIIITLTLHPIRPYRTLIHNIHLPRSPLPTRPSSLFRIRSQPPPNKYNTIWWGGEIFLFADIYVILSRYYDKT